MSTVSDDDEDRKPAARSDGLDEAHNNSHVKPALKKDSRKKTANNKEKHLQWDEEIIEEHDQLRGTRMKIDEPNTPYTHYDSGAESDDSRRPKSPANQKQTLSWDVLQTRLDSVAAVREAYPPSSPSSSHGGGGDGSGADQQSEDGKDDHQKEMRDMEFKEHRKRHYNEMQLVKKFREEHPEGALAIDDNAVDVDAEAEKEE